MQRRIVITGLGVVSPIGIGVSQFEKAALEGRSGITALRPWAGFPLDAYRCQIGGQVRDFQVAQFLEAGLAERVDRYAQFAMVASTEALRDASLAMEHEEPHRVGVIVGAGMGGMMMGEREITKLYLSQRPERVHPNFIPTITLNSASGLLAIQHGAKGPNLTISTACSSGAHAIGQALATIRAGQADVVIAVGADASLTPLVFAGFCSLRALSTKFNKTPNLASRPFDQLRDGFVMGEGAGALILESLSHAKKRRARIYAEVAGYGATSESFHVVIPREDGADMATTMALALDDAGITPAQVDYINAHATSTMVGDAAEVRGIRRLLKGRANHVVVNATKSLIGHTLGAAGAIGAVASVLALQSGKIHPTINYEHPDSDCALPGISAKVQERRAKVALLNAFGFGSNNAALVFKKWQ
ncbi:MAG: beta-ketoacyl-ACP synthase II [Nitrospirae bacterium]|nr:MAG: beta-ketoacyl-ACP synthase II [Nitrospirota bacterium]